MTRQINFVIRKIAFLLGLYVGAAPLRAAELVVIVNVDNAAAQLTPKQVKSHFLRINPSWGGGANVQPIDLPASNPLRATFLTKLIQLPASEYSRYWIERQYASAENPPISAPDESAVINMIGMMKGGIGFVSKAALAAAKNDRVKAVYTVAE